MILPKTVSNLKGFVGMHGGLDTSHFHLLLYIIEQHTEYPERILFGFYVGSYESQI